MKTKRLILTIILLAANAVFAQIVSYREVSVTLTPEQRDTVWLPLRPAAGEQYVAPTNAATVNPPDNAVWNGNIRFYIKKTSGSAATSMAVLIKPAHIDGTIYVCDDTTWAYGSSFTASFNAVIGDGRLHSVSLTGRLAPATAIAAIVKLADSAGGSRTFTIGCQTQ